MDVSCARCGEKWDIYHLRHDAIWETDISEAVKRHVSNNYTPLDFPGIREALARDGWKFGQSVVTVLECPCCKANAEDNEPDPEAVKERKMKRAVLDELLGDDEDAIASMLEDLEG